jgi:hypothetical protein
VFGHCCELEDSLAIAVHNLSGEQREARLDLPREQLDLALEMFSDRAYERLQPEKSDLRIGPYGFRWFRIQPPLLG